MSNSGAPWPRNSAPDVLHRCVVVGAAVLTSWVTPTCGLGRAPGWGQGRQRRGVVVLVKLGLDVTAGSRASICPAKHPQPCLRGDDVHCGAEVQAIWISTRVSRGLSALQLSICSTKVTLYHKRAVTRGGMVNALICAASGGWRILADAAVSYGTGGPLKPCFRTSLRVF